VISGVKDKCFAREEATVGFKCQNKGAGKNRTILSFRHSFVQSDSRKRYAEERMNVQPQNGKCG